jgi:hypothetical protein
MDLALLEILLRKSEGDTLDFKEDQYQFGQPASREEQSKLLKDILAFANAWKEADAYIIVGVVEKDQRLDSICGVTSHLPDHTVQQFVNTKTNAIVKFSVEAVPFKGLWLDVIRINRSQNRPIFATDQFGKVLKNAVYVRRGSATNIADPDEIAAMGKQTVISEAVPKIMLEFADPSRRIRQGTELEVASMHLSDPPKPTVPPPAKRSGRIVPRGLLDHLSDPRPPSDKEWIEYLKARALFQPVGFWLKNIGSVNATNIKVEFRVPHPGLMAVTTYCGPRKPQSRVDDLRYGWAERPLPVEEENDQFLVTVEVPSLQPQAEAWSNGIFYLVALANAEIDCNVTIFADNLPTPLRPLMRLALQTQSRTYEHAELLKLIEDTESENRRRR